MFISVLLSLFIVQSNDKIRRLVLSKSPCLDGGRFRFENILTAFHQDFFCVCVWFYLVLDKKKIEIWLKKKKKKIT